MAKALLAPDAGRLAGVEVLAGGVTVPTVVGLTGADVGTATVALG